MQTQTKQLTEQIRSTKMKIIKTIKEIPIEILIGFGILFLIAIIIVPVIWSGV
jgi:hypothetical protein